MLRDENGATAIEFGLLAIPFFLILGALLETALVFLSGHMFDTAVHDLSRLVRTGQIRQTTIVDANGVRKYLCDEMLGLIRNCDGMHVEVEVVTDFDDVAISAPINMAACSVKAEDCGWDASRPEEYTRGQGSSIVVIQVYYKWESILRLAGFTLGNLGDGTRLMGSSTVFRNEPFT